MSCFDLVGLIKFSIVYLWKPVPIPLLISLELILVTVWDEENKIKFFFLFDDFMVLMIVYKSNWSSNFLYFFMYSSHTVINIHFVISELVSAFHCKSLALILSGINLVSDLRFTCEGSTHGTILERLDALEVQEIMWIFQFWGYSGDLIFSGENLWIFIWCGSGSWFW